MRFLPLLTIIVASAAASSCVQPPPGYEIPEPVVSKPEPVVTRPEPVVSRPEPVVSRPEPAARTPAPAVNTPPLDIASDSVARSLLVNVQLVDPTIIVDAKYFTADNFTGAPLPGYQANRALLRREAARALARVQKRARAEGVALKVFDAYRPVRATLAMVEWTERTRQQRLVREGYIASRSRHNEGVAVDLTLIGGDGRELDMGTPFDTFSPAAHTANASGGVATNRRLLVQLMTAEGFTNYEKEWWHFSYSVPNPLRFDLVIR
jgi:zinc D-Ala-D-Ala dipeptidase